MPHSARTEKLSTYAFWRDEALRWLARGLAIVVLAVALIVGSLATAHAATPEGRSGAAAEAPLPQGPMAAERNRRSGRPLR